MGGESRLRPPTGLLGYLSSPGPHPPWPQSPVQHWAPVRPSGGRWPHRRRRRRPSARRSRRGTASPTASAAGQRSRPPYRCPPSHRAFSCRHGFFFFKTGGRGPPTHTRRYPQDTHSLRLILGPIYLVFRAENEHFNRHLHSSTFGKHHFCNFEYTKNMESIKIKLQKVQKIDKNFDLSGKAGPNAKFFSVKIISHQNSK